MSDVLLILFFQPSRQSSETLLLVVEVHAVSHPLREAVSDLEVLLPTFQVSTCHTEGPQC